MRIFLLVLTVYVFGAVGIGAWLHARAPSMQADVDRVAGKPVSLRTIRRFLYMMALLWPGALFCWSIVSLLASLIRLLKLIAPKRMKAVAQETLYDLSRPSENPAQAGSTVIRAVGDDARASLVTEIRIELVFNGKRKTAIFIRKEKVKDLMLARDPISDLLQSLATDDQDAIDTLQ